MGGRLRRFSGLCPRGGCEGLWVAVVAGVAAVSTVGRREPEYNTLGPLPVLPQRLGWGYVLGNLSGSWFSNQEAGTAVVGVVPLLVFLNEASVNTFLDLALHFFNLFLRSGVGTTSHSRLLKFRFQLQVHPDQFFTGHGRRQGAEHLLKG